MQSNKQPSEEEEPSGIFSSMFADLGNMIAKVSGAAVNKYGNQQELDSPIRIHSNPANQYSRALSTFVYHCVQNGFAVNHDLWEHFSDAADLQYEDSPRWQIFRSILNGVFGNMLVTQYNPLALPMSFQPEMPAPAPTKKASDSTLILFIHDLCMNEQSWQHPAHTNLRKILHKNMHCKISYLRFNSGIHVSHNGWELAKHLRHYSDTHQNIILVGHGMGGLVARSACHYAKELDYDWLNKVSRVVTLGTPHQGALIERIGNFASSALKVAPFSRPLLQLGNMRSDGIHDMRYGNILNVDWQGGQLQTKEFDTRQRSVLIPHIQYLFVAGSLDTEHKASAFEQDHDTMVSVESAWGHNDKATHTLASRNIDRQLYLSTSHLQLLSSDKVCNGVAEWLISD